jgi:hypothetical protein
MEAGYVATSSFAPAADASGLPDADREYLELLKQCLTASIYDESAWHVIEPRDFAPVRLLARPAEAVKTLIRRAILRYCRRYGMMLVKERPFDREMRAEGRDWPCFGYTLVGHRRLENVQRCVEDALRDGVPGDLVEAGVWRGGTSIFMRALLRAHGVTDRVVWAADSFAGMPVPASDTDGDDYSGFEYLRVSREQVRANFARFGLLDEQVRFLEGWFHDTLPAAPIERIAVLRLDGDMYSSTMDALRSLYHRVSPGGYVIVDDFYAWDSCHRAVTEFLRENRIDADIRPVDWTGAYWKVPG